MKNHTPSEEELDRLITRLTQSAVSPSNKYGAKVSYDQLAERIGTSKPKRLSLYKYVAAASVAIIIGVSAFLFTGPQAVEMISQSTNDETIEIVLPDGTQVILSHYSCITYPEVFDEQTRNVELLGEAYFDVHKDKEHPFIVQTQDINIKVLGTQFNVQSYANNPSIKTTLLEGSVAVSNTINENTVTLKPNETAIFNKESALLTQISEIEAEDQVAWRSGKFIFKEVSLSDITIRLSNYFNTLINITDSALKEYKVTARFDSKEELEDILTLLQTAGDFTWSKDPKSTAIIIKPNTKE